MMSAELVLLAAYPVETSRADTVVPEPVASTAGTRLSLLHRWWPRGAHRRTVTVHLRG